jgi:hypothetical protein
MNFAPGLPWVLAAGLALASLAASLHIRRAQFAERLVRIETQQRDAVAALERMQSDLQDSMQVLLSPRRVIARRTAARMLRSRAGRAPLRRSGRSRKVGRERSGQVAGCQM